MPEPHALPRERPARFDAATLAALRHNPPRLGAWAMAARTELFGRQTLLWPTPVTAGSQAPACCAVLRDGAVLALPAAPDASAIHEGDRMLAPVEPDDPAAIRAYLDWLLALADAHEDGALPRCAIAPFSSGPAGTHRLWLVGVARLALPASVRVEARHDLLGIRLAQIALGFGADTLSGPLAEERRLPVAGVTRPDDASVTGLRNLIEQAGLECVTADPGARAPLTSAAPTLRI